MKNEYERYKESFSQDFSVQYKKSYISAKNNYHIHDVLEVMLVRTDGIITMIAEERHPIAANTLLLFNHMDLHYNMLAPANKSHDRYVIFFSPEFVEGLSTPQTDLLECFYFRPFKTPWILPISCQDAAEYSLLLDKIIQLKKENGNYGSELNARLLLGEFLLKVNQNYRNYHKITMLDITAQYRQIYQIINFIHQNYAENLNLDIMSKAFYINKFYLCNIFKKVTGTSPNQYLIRCRIIKAKELLLQGFSVESVCMMTGYNSLPHFSRSFKSQTGISPKKYQLNHKKSFQDTV